jgi:hypothetical protein
VRVFATSPLGWTVMAEKGSFWSSLPGVLTALAGLATAVVGLLSLAASQGWIGGDGGGDADGTGTGAGGEAPARIEVDLPSLQFRAVPGASKEQTVTVTNEGDVATQLADPEITGPGKGQFEVDDGDCPRPLGGGRSCKVVVTYNGGLGDKASATLVITPESGKAAEVRLEAGVI